MITMVHSSSDPVFRAAIEWKLRTIYCLIVGWFLALAGSAFLFVWAAEPFLLFVLTLSMIIIPGVPAFAIWRYAVRIDDEGIWRRRFLRWDLWPWAAFNGGQIEDGLGVDTFLFPEKPWYWRRLNLAILAGKDRKLIKDKIRGIRKRPDISLPDEVIIEFGLMRHARFTPAGVHLWRGWSKRRFVPWSDISPITLKRFDHDRRDFRWLVFRPLGNLLHIVLITGERGEYVRSLPPKWLADGGPWKGASAEVLASFLEKHVPAKQLRVDAMRGAPLNLDECERRLTEAYTTYLRSRNIIRMVPLLSLMWITFMCILIQKGQNPPNVDWLLSIISVFSFVYGVLLNRDLERQFKKKRKELETWREAHPPSGLS